MDGPVISASKIPTEYPCSLISLAREAVTIDIPPPPYPLITPMTFFTCVYSFAGTFMSTFLLGHVPALGQLEQLSAEHEFTFSCSDILFTSYSSTTAINSISQSKFFGNVFTATQLLAVFDVKYFA